MNEFKESKLTHLSRANDSISQAVSELRAVNVLSSQLDLPSSEMEYNRETTKSLIEFHQENAKRHLNDAKLNITEAEKYEY